MRPRLALATVAAAATAVFGGGALLAGPALAAPATGSGQSFTGLEADMSSVTLGNDSAVKLSFAVADSSHHGLTGTVTVKAQQANGNRVLCSATLSGGLGSCHMSDTALFPGDQKLFAAYSGNGSFAPSTSGLVDLTVNPATTHPSMTQSAFQLTFGQEQNDTISVTVGPTLSGELPPSGRFDVMAFVNGVANPPVQICAAFLDNTGSGSCQLTDSAVPVGLFTIFTHYEGDGTYHSSDTPATAIQVSKGQGAPALTLPTAKLAFDRENGAKFSYRVGPAAMTPPSGQVSVSAVSAANGQTTPICSGAVSDGSCQLTGATLAPGRYLVTATYGGDANYAGASTTAQPFTIAKVPSRTVLHRSPAKVRFGHEGAEHISVQVTRRDGRVPSGTVAVKAGSVTLCTIKLKVGKGGCSLTAKKLRVGTYHLVASYSGGTIVAKSASGSVKLVVTK
ncbi:MAG TPA: Ig-like domain-containing protein [Streptosporangiaceae bacterium]|nr:Ig-like domain-containing protein [Streptosporangiaceae bacterium]